MPVAHPILRFDDRRRLVVIISHLVAGYAHPIARDHPVRMTIVVVHRSINVVMLEVVEDVETELFLLEQPLFFRL